MAFSTFTVSCYDHLHTVPKYFHHPSLLFPLLLPKFTLLLPFPLERFCSDVYTDIPAFISLPCNLPEVNTVKLSS